MKRVRPSFQFHLAIYLALCFFLPACDTIQGFFDSPPKKQTEKTETVGDEDIKKQTKPKKVLSAKTKNEDDTAPVPDAPDAGNTPATATDETIVQPKKSEDNKKLKKVDLKAATIPAFETEAPLHITKRIGGFPERIHADESHVFLDDGQNLIVYSDTLDYIGKAPRAYPITKVTPVSLAGQTMLYVSEDNNVLEIFSVTNDATTQKPVVRPQDSFDVGGPFSWLDSKTLLVFLDSKIQFLDFSDPTNVTVLRELPIGGVGDKLILKNQLYLSRGEFLDIVSIDAGSLTSSLRVGQNYRFLGATHENDTNLLYIALLDAQNRATSIQALKLNPDATGVTDLGIPQMLPEPLTDAKASLSSGLLFGKTESGNLRFFDLKTRRFLRGQLDRESGIATADLYRDWLYLIQNSQVAQYRLQIHRDIIDQYKPATPTVASPPPLAQIGAEQTLKDEYTLAAGKGVSFDKNAKAVFLLDQNHIVVLQENASGKQEILVSEDLNAENFSLRELSAPADRIKTTLSTPFGLLFSTENGDVYFLDVSLRALQKWPLQLTGLQSWAIAEQNDDYLLAAVIKTSAPEPKSKPRAAAKPKAPDGFSLQFYLLTSPTQIEPAAQLALTAPGFITSMGYDMFALVTQTELLFYTARDINEPRPLENQTKTYTVPGTLIGAKLSPQKDLIYAFLQDGAQRKIHVFDYEQPQNAVTLMPVGDLSSSQFEASSFSRGGQLFLLPTAKGTYFYDLSNVQNQNEKDLIKAHWPIPAEALDVAGRGQFVCTALGPRGVWCGDLLFY